MFFMDTLAFTESNLMPSFPCVKPLAMQSMFADPGLVFASEYDEWYIMFGL